MKIFIIDTPQIYRLPMPFVYPKHNRNYGVEEDFYQYVSSNTSLTTDNADHADWHYLPIFWTSWHLQHDYGTSGVEELQTLVNNLVLNPHKTFTICQYDDGTIVDLPNAIQFLASRKTENGFDIPLLSLPHRKPFFPTRKRYLASFVGRKNTHAIREKLFQLFKHQSNFLLYDGNFGTGRYVKTLLESYVALCPRGYGGSSFRFFEAMQLGVVPFLIGDIDVRPFKKFIAWDEISFYSETPLNLIDTLTRISKDQLIVMGNKAKQVYETYFARQQWCKMTLRLLEEMSHNNSS